MTAFEQIGSGLATADLAVARAIGIIVAFTHRAEAPVNISCQLVEETSGNDEPQRGRFLQWTNLKLVIPVQSGITRDLDATRQAIIGGDKIEYPLGSGRLFYVMPDELKKIHNGYSYLCVARSEKTLTLGPKS